MKNADIAKLEIEKLRDFKSRGYNFVCLGCYLAYKRKPTQEYEDGHGGRLIEMCGCGSDIFTTVEKQIEELKKKNDLVGRI